MLAVNLDIAAGIGDDGVWHLLLLVLHLAGLPAHKALDGEECVLGVDDSLPLGDLHGQVRACGWGMSKTVQPEERGSCRWSKL